MASHFTPREVERIKERILAKLAKGFSPVAAAKAGGIHRRTLLTWRKEDPEFEEACVDAIEAGTDELEDTALTRAKKSDVVLMFLLNGRRPKKFRRKPIDGEEDDGRIVNFTFNIGQNVPIHETAPVSPPVGGNLLSSRPSGGNGTLQLDRSLDEDREDGRVHGLDIRASVPGSER